MHSVQNTVLLYFSFLAQLMGKEPDQWLSASTIDEKGVTYALSMQSVIDN